MADLDPRVAITLFDISRAAHAIGAPWSLIGDEALRVRGVPGPTMGIDLLVASESIEVFAEKLVTGFHWTPLAYDRERACNVTARRVKLECFEDPALADIGQVRQRISLDSFVCVQVTLFAAQHPIELDMIEPESDDPMFHAYSIATAPLGGVLLMKAKLGRTRDFEAIQHTAENLSATAMSEAIAWAHARDPENAEVLAKIVRAAQERRVPIDRARGKTH